MVPGGQHLFIRMTNAPSTRSIPGTTYEMESILAPGARYRIVNIIDWEEPGQGSGRARYMEVEHL
jgi:hypothetical protein